MILTDVDTTQPLEAIYQHLLTYIKTNNIVFQRIETSKLEYKCS